MVTAPPHLSIHTPLTRVGGLAGPATLTQAQGHCLHGLLSRHCQTQAGPAT